MVITVVQRALLWTGAGGTLVLILVGAGTALSRSAPPPFQILLTGAGMALWMLSPYWGAFKQQRQPPRTQAEAGVRLAGLVLVVALGAYAYLSGWVFYTGPTRATGQGMLALIVPLYQWIILGIASGLRWIVRGAARILERRRAK